MAEELKQYPQWKQAVQEFIGSNPQPGTVISAKWKQQHFGLLPPKKGTIEQIGEYHLKMLSAFESFAKTLTEDYQIHLKSDRRGGHVVLAPNQQTGTAVQDCQRHIRKALTKSRFKLENVAVDALTTEERKEHTDSQVRLAMTASMFRKVKQLSL